jgi:hypothetical protein
VVDNAARKMTQEGHFRTSDIPIAHILVCSSFMVWLHVSTFPASVNASLFHRQPAPAKRGGHLNFY